MSAVVLDARKDAETTATGQVNDKETHDLCVLILKTADSPEPHYSKGELVRCIRYLWKLLNGREL